LEFDVEAFLDVLLEFPKTDRDADAQMHASLNAERLGRFHGERRVDAEIKAEPHQGNIDVAPEHGKAANLRTRETDEAPDFDVDLGRSPHHSAGIALLE